MVRPPTASALGDVLADEVVEDEAGEAAAFGVEGGGAAVDVVVGLLAAGEGEVAELEGVGGDEVEEGGPVVGRHDSFFSSARGCPPILACKFLRINNLRRTGSRKIVITKDLRPKSS